MFGDLYDKLLWFCLATILLALSLLLWSAQGSAGGAYRPGAALDKALEREMAYQARIALLQKLYAPAQLLITNADYQGALFKLDEINRRYPSEAHGHILKGEILQQMGAPDEALHSFVAGVKLNGDYLDRKSPLSRRSEIEKAADEGARTVRARLSAHPDNGSLALKLKEVNYLKSRLAGGCE